MRFVSSDQKLGFGCDSAFEDAVVVILGGDDGDPLRRVHKMGDGSDGVDPRVRLLFGKAKLIPQNTVELGQDKRGDEQVDLPPADARKDLVGLASREGEGGDQDIGVQDDSHGAGGSSADRMDESIHILFRPDPEGLSLQGCLPLEFPPPLFIEVHAQGLPDQLALRSVFFPGPALGLLDKLGGERDRPRLGRSHPRGLPWSDLT